MPLSSDSLNRLASSVIGGNRSDIAEAIAAHPELRAWRNPLGQTLLDFFAFCNDYEAVQAVLLAAPEQAAMRDTLGQTPAHVAAREGNELLLTPLIAACPACLTMTDNSGQTPAHVAAQVGNNPLLASLLAACPACATMADNSGSTPATLSDLAAGRGPPSNHSNGLRSWAARIFSCSTHRLRG